MTELQTAMQAHGFRTALDVLLEPHPNQHCPHFGGWLEVWLLTPLEVGLCTVTGEVCHMGKHWARTVCTQNKTCPFKTKVGNIPPLAPPERYDPPISLHEVQVGSHRPKPKRSKT